MTTGRPDSTAIIAAMVRSSQGGGRKTRIFRQANTNHRRGSEYLETCLESDLLVEHDGEFFPTEKGQRLLEHWAEVEQRLPRG